METTGQRIALSRKLKNLTKRELATRLDVHESSINKYENDLVDFSVSKIKEIAKILDVSPAYLIGWTDNRHYVISGDNNVQVNDNQGTIENIGYITYNNNTIEETNPADGNLDDTIRLQEENEIVQADMLVLLKEILKTNKAILEELKKK